MMYRYEYNKIKNLYCETFNMIAMFVFLQNYIQVKNLISLSKFMFISFAEYYSQDQQMNDILFI